MEPDPTSEVRSVAPMELEPIVGALYSITNVLVSKRLVLLCGLKLFVCEVHDVEFALSASLVVPVIVVKPGKQRNFSVQVSPFEFSWWVMRSDPPTRSENLQVSTPSFFFDVYCSRLHHLQ